MVKYQCDIRVCTQKKEKDGLQYKEFVIHMSIDHDSLNVMISIKLTILNN